MYGTNFASNWYDQYKAGTALQRERVRRMMRTAPVDGIAYDRTKASDRLKDGPRAKAVWAIWSVLGAAAACGLVYMIVRVFAG